MNAANYLDLGIRMLGLFITGTDTGVGKTQAACLIARQAAARGLRVGAYKPVCSGAEFEASGQPAWDDIQRLHSAINVPATINDICPQRFLAPLAPPLAAREEQRSIDAAQLRNGISIWRDRVDLLLVEGAGGLFCPLTETQTFAEFAVDVGFPILIVARPSLGTINHTLLTIAAARAHRLHIAGVIFCETTTASDDPSVPTNAAEIERRSGIPVFGTIPFEKHDVLLHQHRPVSINWPQLATS